ncbi:MAG TPA: transglutaminase-like domain-containing protein [Methanomassiliicoccales archaeon]|nr:transglutaminase-like domain-containing protein [Methanomassiliicoccales archaeon]
MLARKDAPKVLIALLLTAVVIASGCLSSPDQEGTGDSIFTSAMGEYREANYRNASTLFKDASQAYSLEGEETKAIRATNWKIICQRMTMEFPYTRGEAEVLLEEAFPNISKETRDGWLDSDRIEKIVSDGEVLYFQSIVDNICYRNLTLIREKTAEMGHTPIFDSPAIRDIVWNDTQEDQGPYLNPIEFNGSGGLSVPGDQLPDHGTLQMWIPHPIMTSSQANVSVVSIEPQEYVVEGADVHADLGLAYLEIPLEEIQGDIEVSIDFKFTEYQRSFKIDPEDVGEYDRESPEYITYTKSSPNIVVTPEISDLARSIVGGEKNPYLQTQMIYWYIVNNMRYSFMPHLYLSTAHIPESQYVHERGYGDCGAQSAYFCALLRSLGIPARDTGGWHLVPGIAASHYWAEFLIPGYGWIPADVTMAEIADWSFDATEEERTTFKEFYFCNLDPYRYVIQKDVDIPMHPEPGDFILFIMAHKGASGVCLTSTEDVELIMYEYWDFDINPVV